MLVVSAGQTVVAKLPVTWPPPFPNVTSNVVGSQYGAPWAIPVEIHFRSALL